jgi:hypothetical protein
MSKRILFPKDSGIYILTPVESCGLSISEIANKDVPSGVPYLIVDESDIPQDREFRDAWEADFSQPHGVGGQGPVVKQEVIEAEFTQVEESLPTEEV